MSFILPFLRITNDLIIFLLLLAKCCRNGKWSFLEGVKSSGAPPPRNVLVQQFIRDKGLLETLCNYVCTNLNFFDSEKFLQSHLEFVIYLFLFPGISNKRFPAFKTGNLLLYSYDCGVTRCHT